MLGTVNVLKFRTLFVLKIWVIKAEVQKRLVRIANSEDPYPTASVSARIPTCLKSTGI